MRYLVFVAEIPAVLLYGSYGLLLVHDGEDFGFVCDDYFDDNACDVVCGQLGYR